MKTFKLNATPRIDLGKKASKALRAENKIPCVIYGGKHVELTDGKYEGPLAPGEKVVPVGSKGKALITTDFTVGFDDIRKLLKVFRRLVLNGQTVLVIEHNLDVIKTADYIIDMGPEGGKGGGELLSCGTPEEVAKSSKGYTPRFLREELGL